MKTRVVWVHRIAILGWSSISSTACQSEHTWGVGLGDASFDIWPSPSDQGHDIGSENEMSVWVDRAPSEVSDGSVFTDIATQNGDFFEVPARQVTGGCGTVCAVVRNGSVYCWGVSAILNNGGTADERFRPRRIEGFDNILQFASSCYVGCGVDSNHNVWCFGSNYNSLQTGSSEQYLRAGRQRLDVAGVEQVALWGYTFLARRATGSLVVVSGTNELREFFLSSAITDVQVGSDGYCVILSNGHVACVDSNAPSAMPREVDGLDGVVAISPGGRHSCVLKRDGTVWCWGRDEHGETGIPPENAERCFDGTFRDSRGALIERYYACTEQPRQVRGLNEVAELYAVGDRTCVLKRDGTVWCWGQNDFGFLGDGLPPTERCPITPWNPLEATPDPLICRRLPVRVVGLANIVSLSSGSNSASAVDSTGQVWCWGGNGQGHLGTGDQVSSAIPVLVPASALRRDR